MSDVGGDTGDMNDRLSDTEIESLMAGSTEADPSLGELIAGVKEFAEWRPDPSQRASHVAGAVSEARVATKGASSVVDELSVAPMTRRQQMIGRIMSTRLAKVLAGALAALLATSGIAWAATGSNPVDQVSSVTQQVGHIFGADVSDVQEPDVEEPEADDQDEIDLDESEIEDDDSAEVDDDEQDDVEDDHSADVDENESDEVEDDDSAEVDDNESDDVDENESDEVEDDDSAEVDDDESDEVNDDESDGSYSEHESDDESGHDDDGGYDD